MTKKLIRQTELQLDIEDIQDCDTVFGIYDSLIDGSDLECFALKKKIKKKIKKIVHLLKHVV